MIKRSVHQENITIVNIYAPETGVFKHIRQISTDLNVDIDSDTIIGDFNMPL